MPTFVRGAVGVAFVAAAVLLLSGCSTSLVVDGSTVTVAAPQPFTSYNDRTTFGNTPENLGIVAATNANFTYYNDVPELVRDESFGHYEIVSQDPFAVKYTIAEGVTWSDGVAVDGADLLLAWAANSGHFTTPGFDPAKHVDSATGLFTPFPDAAVFFDGASHSGLQHVTSVPELGPDGRSITLVYDEFFVDWELAFQVGLPAHIVAEQAVPIAKTKDLSRDAVAKRRVISAITNDNTDTLSALSQVWNSDFTIGEKPNPKLLVGSGPYSITTIVPNESVTLTANPLYTGSRKPHYEKVVVRTISDPLEAVKALRSGGVDVIAPPPTEDLVDSLGDSDGITVLISASGSFEHLDLQLRDSKNDTFDDPLVREAFLAAVPRQQLLDAIVTPVEPKAALRDSFVFTPGTEGYDASVGSNGSEEYARVDTARSKALLAKAGVINPVVCILFDPSNPRRVAEFDIIQQGAEKAGFTVTDCSQADWQGFLGVNDSYDAALFSWTDSTTALSGPAARLGGGSTISNYSHYSSEKVDALLAQLAVESDPAAQRALLASVDSELWTDAYGLPLFQHPAVVAFSTAVSGIAPAPLAPTLLWNLWQWQPSTEGN